MGHFSHAHGPGQPGTAFEGVQHTQQSGAGFQARGVCRPFAHGAPQHRQQLQGLFLKNGEQVRVDHILGINLLRRFLAGRWQCGCRRRCLRQGIHVRGSGRYQLSAVIRDRVRHRVCDHQGGRTDFGIQYALQGVVHVLRSTGQKTCGKLVQHGANFFSGTHQACHLLRHTTGLWCHVLQGMLQLPRQSRQLRKTDRG